KNRRSLVMGCRLRWQRRAFVTRGETRISFKAYQRLPSRAEFYRANRIETVPLLIMALPVSLQPCQSSPQFVVLVDGAVVAHSGCGGRSHNKLIEGRFVVQEAVELAFRARLRTPLHEIIGGGDRKAVSQFIRGAIRQGPITGEKMKSPAFFRSEHADKRE